MDVNSFNNIQTVSYVLVTLTIVLIFVLIYNKKQKKGVSIHLIDNQINSPKEMLENKMEAENSKIDNAEKENILGVSIYQNNKKQEIKFNMSPLVLIFNLGKKIYNPNYRENNLVLSNFKDLFLNMQIKLNYLYDNGFFDVREETLAKIKKVISKGRFKPILDVFNEMVSEYGKKISGERYFKKILIDSISHSCYNIYEGSEVEKQYNNFVALKNTAQSKRNNKIPLSSEDEIVLNSFEELKEIKKEIEGVTKNKNIQILFLDKNENELYLYIDYNDLFHKDVFKIINYFENDAALNKIKFYI